MSKQVCVPFLDEYVSQENYTPILPTSRNTVALKRSSEALTNYVKATDSSVTHLLNTSSIKNVIAELEKRRAEFSAIACAAEARAREAEEKCEQAVNRLEQEKNQRILAEQRLREAEAECQRQLHS